MRSRADELIVWTGHRNGQAIAYDLGDGRDQLRPRRENGKPADGAPVLNARRLFFSRVPLTWKEWAEFWHKDHNGEEYPPLLSDSMRLVPFTPERRSERDGRAAEGPRSTARDRRGALECGHSFPLWLWRLPKAGMNARTSIRKRKRHGSWTAILTGWVDPIAHLGVKGPTIPGSNELVEERVAAPARREKFFARR